MSLQVFVASIGVVLTFAGLRIGLATAFPTALVPFESAAQVVGSNMMFLSLLIISSQHYSKKQVWVTVNTAMVGLLLAAQYIGQTHGMIGMANVGTTFTALCTVHALLLGGWGPVGRD
jgi:hypothetical protein